MNKFPIIIVGSGKAALLHLNAYLKLWGGCELPMIYIIAGSTIEPDIIAFSKTYSSALHLIKFQQVEELAQSNPIVDICTPTTTHGKVLKALFNIGFKRFLIEKPAVTTYEDLEWIAEHDLRLEIMQNYLFSKATKRVIDMIHSQVIELKTIISIFCKNRTRDSIDRRGFDGNEPPHIFTIELPHQIYLANAFAGSARIVSTFAQNKRTKNSIFPNQDSGVIILEHSNKCQNGSEFTASFHYSCLSSSKTIKCIILNCDANKSVTVHYPISKTHLTSTVTMTNENGCQHTEIFEDDDMMKEALKHYLLVLSSDTPNSSIGKFESTRLIIDAITKDCTKQLSSKKQ